MCPGHGRERAGGPRTTVESKAEMPVAKPLRMLSAYLTTRATSMPDDTHGVAHTLCHAQPTSNPRARPCAHTHIHEVARAPPMELIRITHTTTPSKP